MATTARSKAASTRKRAPVGTNQEPRRHSQVFGDFILATVEYANHPETPAATREAMHELMKWMHDQLATAFAKHDAAARKRSAKEVR